MTLNDVLAQIEQDGRSWVVQPDGKIRLSAEPDDTTNICPLSSLLTRAGKPYRRSYEWTQVATVLNLEQYDAHDLVQAADYDAAYLADYHYPDRLIDLRRRLLAACHLPPEEENA